VVQALLPLTRFSGPLRSIFHCTCSGCSSNPKASLDRKRPKGRPNHTWLRAVEADLKPLNICLSSPWKNATIRETWRSVLDMATPRTCSMPENRRHLTVAINIYDRIVLQFLPFTILTYMVQTYNYKVTRNIHCRPTAKRKTHKSGFHYPS